MEMNTLLIAMLTMGGLGMLFSTGLSFADKKLRVEEDPRLGLVLAALPGANCGGCGYAGCANFAEHIVTGKAAISGCPVCSAESVVEIAAIMGVAAEAGERRVARIMCQGGVAETAKKAQYWGIPSCAAAKLMGGGEKLCAYGCLGFGDCVKACPFDAMYMNDNGLPVVREERCTGCGNCVAACPRGVIEMHPESHHLLVLCKNLDAPKEARKVCTRACIACAICVRAVQNGGMRMDDNLARINYDVYGREAQLPTDKCPTACLVVYNHAPQAAEQRKVAEERLVA